MADENTELKTYRIILKDGRQFKVRAKSVEVSSQTGVRFDKDRSTSHPEIYVAYAEVAIIAEESIFIETNSLNEHYFQRG